MSSSSFRQRGGLREGTGVEPLKKVARSAAEQLIAGEGLGVREK